MLNHPVIAAIGTASPELYVTQRDAYDFYAACGAMPPAQQDLYARLLLDSPIRGRHFGLPRKEDVLNEDPDALIERFATYGRRLSAEAARHALTEADIAPGDVGAVVTNTCTGYLCPGLSSYVAEDLGLTDSVKPLDIMGMGCGAALPNLESGCALLASGLKRPVLCVATEICSATHFMDDDPGLTVSNCIFGDGAAAVVLRPDGDGPVTLRDFESGLFPQHRAALRYDHQGGRLRNRLGRRVPVIGAACVQEVAGRLLKRNRLTPADIGWWAVHAGGTAVLDEVARQLDLPRSALAASYHTFEQYGNMSSATVLFALQHAIEQGRTRGPGMLMAFGAGFTAFAALASGRG